jgi:hypothetical protein
MPTAAEPTAVSTMAGTIAESRQITYFAFFVLIFNIRFEHEIMLLTFYTRKTRRNYGNICTIPISVLAFVAQCFHSMFPLNVSTQCFRVSLYIERLCTQRSLHTRGGSFLISLLWLTRSSGYYLMTRSFHAYVFCTTHICYIQRDMM